MQIFRQEKLISFKEAAATKRFGSLILLIIFDYVGGKKTVCSISWNR